jgi:uncharacterized paraquat-inducible protein A
MKRKYNVLKSIIPAKTFLPVCFFYLSLITILAACSGNKKTDTANSPAVADTTQVAEAFICPMDCESGKTYDKAGPCPVCGMDLVKKE